MTTDVTGIVLLDSGTGIGPRDHHRSLYRPDQRMAGLDTAVEHADSDARSGRRVERPLAGDLSRPRSLQLDAADRACGQAPGRKVTLGRRRHARMVRLSATRRGRVDRHELGLQLYRYLLHSGGHSGWSGRMAEYLRFYASACGG